MACADVADELRVDVMKQLLQPVWGRVVLEGSESERGWGCGSDVHGRRLNFSK